MARFAAVLLAVAAILAAGRTGHAAPSAAEVSWRAVVPDAVLRRFRADTSFVNNGMAGGVAKGAGRSTRDLDYDDYTRLPPAAGMDAPSDGMAGGMAKGAGRSTSGLDYDDYTRLPPTAGKAAPSNEMAGGMAKGAGRSTRDLDYDDYTHLHPAAGMEAPSNGMAGGMVKGAGRSTSELDYDDYTRLPPAARKAAPSNGMASGMAKGAARSTSSLDYDDYTILPPADGKAAPSGYNYKAPSEGTRVREDDGPFGYDYKAPSERRADGSVTASESRGGREKATTTVFFHEEAVRVGERLHFRFPAAAPAPLGLLPRHAAASVPFSTPALPSILAMFRVPPGSAQAAGMAETLRTCEWPPLAGESKFCASSLEEMVERAMATLETRDVRAVTSTLPRAGAPLQPYTVRSVRRVDGASFVACHDEVYPYTVYRCHTTGPARAYMMEMEGSGGAAVTVATVCHTDTSRWNPEHLSFKLLGSKPGGAPICHLMPYGHIIWAKNVKISPA